MKRISLILLSIICLSILAGCQGTGAENASPDQTAAEATPADGDSGDVVEEETVVNNPIRTVRTIDMDVIFGGFQQVSETAQFPVTVVEENGILTTEDELGNVWTVYGFADVEMASDQFDVFANSFEERKETRKDLTHEETGEGVERSVAMLSKKKDYLFQVIQQDNMLITMEGKAKNQEIMYAFVTEYFYAISPYLPSTLAEDDALYMPEQNELINEVGERVQVVVKELDLPAIKRENTTSDVFSQNKNVAILTENENFAFRVSIFETEKAAQAYAEETNQFYNEFGVASVVKEDAFGQRYIFKDLGMGEYNELIVDGQTVITVIELTGDQAYAENAVAIYSDTKSTLATQSSEN